MSAVRWQIFYEDLNMRGTTNPLLTGPTHGVVGIVQKLDDEPRCQVLHTVDFYWWKDGMWKGGDIFGALDQASTPEGVRFLKHGRTIRTARFKEIMSAAVALSHKWDGE